jgi:hypothetical protein
MTTKKNDHKEALGKWIETAKSARLTREQEAEAAGLLKETLLGGKTGIATAVEAILNLPWNVAVDAVVAAWPELKAAARKQFTTGLAAPQNESSRRLRLSLGRGLLPVDAGAALKLIEAVCIEMNAASEEGPTPKDRQNFFNVLIGKNKPWLQNLPVGELKASASAVIFHGAIAACFPGPCPPFSQLAALRWIASVAPLEKLPAASLDAIAKGVARWNPKMQAELRAAIPDIPQAIEAALKSPSKKEPSAPDGKPREANPEKQKQPEAKPPRSHNPPPPGFDLAGSLRQIEAHVHLLRNELNQAKSELRKQREQSAGRDRRKNPVESAPPPPEEFEALQRVNRQLEETILGLRQQLEDLKTDHEDIAASMNAHGDSPLTDAKEQFKALLGIKLRPDFTEFEALAKEPPDEVFREHYRLLLDSVFKILETQGVVLKES